MGFKRVLATGLFGLLFLLAINCPVFAQGGSGTINGTVYDQSGSVVPNAQITLTREGTGDIRRVQSNAEGFFALVALPVGTYLIEVEFEGFNRWIQSGIALSTNDKVTVPNINLTPRSISQVVEVSAVAEAAVPVSSIEKSAVIPSKTIQNVSIVGRNAVEMLKILPGVIVPETDNYEVASFGSGGIGTVHVTGIRNDAVAISVDGSNTIDVGNNGGSSVTPNVEMVQEVKVETAAMSAENARGPVSVSAISKSGTSDFHGEAYVYARHYNLNSQDWQANRYGFEKPKSKFIYPGFNIGGPVIIPGTDFNKNRDKLFFFAGFEWSRQDVDLGIDNNKTWVPTAKMRQGDFSELAGGNYPLSGYDVAGVPGNTIDGKPFYNGGVLINPSLMDPGGKIMMNLYPLPNRDPKTSNGFNYISQLVVPQHRAQQLVRVDYSISDRTKLYTRFNHEGETQNWPYCLWWNNANQVPSPSNLSGSLRSYSTSTNVVQVLNPTTTNEVMFSATYYNLPFDFDDPGKMSRKSLGYPYKGMFGNTDVIPNVTDWSGGVATMYQPGGFPRNATKWTLSVDDNFSKVIGTHSLKFGAHYEFITNTEGTSQADSGILTPTNWGGYSTGNAYADLLVGYIGAYEEYSKNFETATRQREFAFYVQDSWKTSRRLTLELGVRFYHLGQAYDNEGLIAGFDSTRYKANAPATDFTGIVGHFRGDKSLPRSIWKTPFLNVGPRVGFAYDITGKGNTVVRGGIGMFVYRDQFNAPIAAMQNPPKMIHSVIGWGAGTLAGIDKIDPTKNLPKSSLSVLEIGDDKLPTTYNWNFTISHRLPQSIVAEVSYVGNRSVNQVTPRDSYNYNRIPEGAQFGLPLGTDDNAYRPYTQYIDIAVKAHLLSQNYHSMQLTLNRQLGRFNFSTAYTFSKAMGIGGDFWSGGGGEVDPYDWKGRNYAPLNFDRTHVFSIAYVYTLPEFTKNRVLGGIANGWQFSGITQMQSGGPMSFTSGGTQGRLRIQGTMAKAMAYNPDGSIMANSNDISGRNVAGTADTNPRPLMTCHPASGLAKGQYVNPSCFQAPLPGKNGTYVLPYIHGPGFMNHDLSTFKNFSVNQDGSQKIQIRFNAYNFMNHPNAYFLDNDPNLVLNYTNGVLNPNKNFGIPVDKRGKRILQFAIKFIF